MAWLPAVDPSASGPEVAYAVLVAQNSLEVDTLHMGTFLPAPPASAVESGALGYAH